MTALAYPFFRDLVEVVGRLLALQDDFTTAQVQRRMLTSWGDRATSRLAAQKLITTLVDWEVLRSTNKKGHFLLARRITSSIPDLQLWLMEALLSASAAEEIEAQQLLRLPESFPFTLSIGVADLRRYERFNIHRQGLDMDMVALRKVRLEPPTKLRKKPGQTRSASVSPVTTIFERDSPRAIDQKREHTEAGQSSLHQVTSSVRVQRNVAIPASFFAGPLTECAEQFREGHYFSCIALAESILEAAILRVAQVKLEVVPDQHGAFETNVRGLYERKLITDACKFKLEQMWTNRHLFHNLRLTAESERNKLKEGARDTLSLVHFLMHEFFDVPEREGMVVPADSEHWSLTKYVKRDEH